MSTRILGDMRIFQSVFNDLKLRHELVTDSNGVQRYAYVYDGVDPYQLEDNAYPLTVSLIARKVADARLDELKAFQKEWYTDGNGVLSEKPDADTDWLGADLYDRIAELSQPSQGKAKAQSIGPPTNREETA